MEDILSLQEGRQQNPENEVEEACFTMRRWPRVGWALPGGKGVSCGPMGCEPCRVGTEVWPLESNADMNFDGGDNGELGASPGSSWPSKHLLGNGEANWPGDWAS